MGSLQGQPHTNGELERKCILTDTLFWISVGYLPIKKSLYWQIPFFLQMFHAEHSAMKYPSLQGTVIYGYARSKLTIEEIRSKCSKTVVAK